MRTFTDAVAQMYQYSPLDTIKWEPLAQGLYFTSCLTQCIFLSTESLLTAGTDGHAVVWPLSGDKTRPSTDSSTSNLTWQQPIRIHQSSSKAMDSLCLDTSTKVIVSGGDDGSISILLTSTAKTQSSATTYKATPVILSRTHASAVTACAILAQHDRIFVATSGNDQWLRLWEVYIRSDEDSVTLPTIPKYEKSIDIRRVGKIKTNVADVSSLAVLATEDDGLYAKVLICGVGMEVVRVQWNV